MDTSRPSKTNGNTQYFEDIHVGMSAMFSKTITEADIVLFSGVTGDMNPVHIDEIYASATRFKGRIAHGMLTASLISTVLGTRLPGPGCIYVSQNLKFTAPVYAGDTVNAQVLVTDKIVKKSRIICHTACWVGEKQVLDGEAAMMVPNRT
ncbi:MAG: MaoC family dehydratase [Pseudomonadota bacterium]